MKPEVLKAIEDVSHNKKTVLLLTNYNLREVPNSVWELIELEALYLSNTKLRTIPKDIKKLRKLKFLYLNENLIEKLPDELCELISLELLELWGNQITTLPANFGKLINLSSLSIGGNRFDILPTTIYELPKLKLLSAWGNQVTSISKEIVQLTNLEILDLSNNKILFLPKEIANLKKLSILDIRNNFIRSLPIAYRNSENSFSYVHFDGNPLGLPPEILKNTNAKTIFELYFKNVFGNVKPINEIKLIFVGQGSVGKTSLVERLLFDTFDSQQQKTEGISIRQWQIDEYGNLVPEHKRQRNSSLKVSSDKEEEQIRLNIWDFGGQEIMHATHQFFLTKRSLYLLVLDTRLTQEENRVEYWLKIIQSFGGESPVLVVGNKTDQHSLDIDRTGLQRKYPNIVGVLETSAKSGVGVSELRLAITQQVNSIPHVRDTLPILWFSIKTKLEKLSHKKITLL